MSGTIPNVNNPERSAVMMTRRHALKTASLAATACAIGAGLEEGKAQNTPPMASVVYHK